MILDISYFQKINNTYNSSSKQETDLFLLNRHVNRQFTDSIDYHKVLKNGSEFDLIIQRYAEQKNKKKIKSRPGQYVKMGDLIEWQGHKWIVISIDPDDKTYLSADMILCNFVLNWQNSDGKIITIDCYAENQTKYSSGIEGNKTLQMGDLQYGLTLPLNDDTKILKRDKRFVVDLIDIETPDVYKLTNREVIINNYSYFDRGGTISLTLSYDAFSKDKDKLVNGESDKKVWICDYIEPTTPPLPTDPGDDEEPNRSPIFSQISITWKGDKIINAGGTAKTFTATFTDKDGNILTDINFEWKVSIADEFSSILSVETLSDKRCKVKLGYDDLVFGNYVKISVVVEDKEIASELIEIGGNL